ncbi:Tab2/Atab2 family RNA-binding protein [Geitlerinema sp. PCC 9228]|uniref:Tab2/Atab2 family RNA-binding protein n=1 Tax=Geitlerinema sp. PCC 9228 TaxID=111611 RepID=UPI0008F9CD7A|nr:Tab2/Atab2 family RNA-binding protein [Geitlerinema sp. PCC 9228]
MSTTWELDFYSRPIVDENNKKIWELLVCESPMEVARDPDSLFRFAKYCPSNQVNSIWLTSALQEAIDQAPSPPVRIRFFRRQMNNMISKACKDMGLQAVPSQRTVALSCWLQERMEKVYPQDPNFQESAMNAPGVRFNAPTPQPLPDAMRGEKWGFVSLPAQEFQQMSAWEISFGEGFPLSLLDIDPKTPVPGLIVFSRRATPLAAWMSGLELDAIAFHEWASQLVLATGFSEAWILAQLNDDTTRQEAQGFQQLKEKAGGLHFLAVQSDPNSESFAGFWLLQELDLA